MPRLPDPRLWAPLALALVALVLREATRSAPAPRPELGRGVELPLPRSSAAPRKALEYELDASASSVRFRVERDGESRLFACPVAEGHLLLSPDQSASRLRLRLNLTSLRPVSGSGDDEPELWDPLGLKKRTEFVYEATLQSVATTPIPCLTHTLWLGAVRFGGRTVRQPMGLWQTAVPGRQLRLQGHGTVAGDAYGLTPRGLLAFLHGHHAVTLGLDLAWRRNTGH